MRKVLVFLLLMLPVSALASDGDFVPSADVSKGNYYSQTYALCDGVLESDSTCDEFDLQTVGMPDYMIFSRVAVDSDCSGDVTIAINAQTLTGGDEHVVATLSDSTTSAKITGPLPRFIDADLTNQTGCDDGAADTGVTVHMQLFFKKN